MPAPLFLGIDLGTSACRGMVIDSAGSLEAGVSVPLPAPYRRGKHSEQQPDLWWKAVLEVLTDISAQLAPRAPVALAVDGTSASLMVCDDHGRPLGPALMYDDARAQAESERSCSVVPVDSAAQTAGSSLAKLLYLQHRTSGVRHALHQADWIVGQLSGQYGHSDENNCLKLGYDVLRRKWPEWLKDLGVDPACLPEVHQPGRPLARMTPELAKTLGWDPPPWIISGTTDSTAAFLASGVQQPGEGVTTLGSTLVVKILSPHPINVPEYGIYSHRLGEMWLVGGASNSGGAVLLEYFDIAQVEALTPRLNPDQPTGLDYYPLCTPGERFPVHDPELHPRLSPRPADDAVFLQGMLEGIARIEQCGYRKLQNLGAPTLSAIYTCGGGARNPAWLRIRQNYLQVPIYRAAQEEAAYGCALLARSGYQRI